MFLVEIGGFWVKPEAVEAIDLAYNPAVFRTATRVHLSCGSIVWFEDEPSVIAKLLADATRPLPWTGVRSD